MRAAEPNYRTAPEYAETLGPEVGDLAAAVRFEPFPEQQLVLDDMFGMDARGRTAAFEAAVIAARQNLKTGLFKQAALGWLFLLDLPLVVWSAHEFRTSQEAFRDMETLIDGSDMLRKRVRKIHRGNGDEAIELLSGARLMFKARTNGGGRGLTGHRVVLDEAFALQPAHMGALLPTLNAVPDPQVVYGSSAGLIGSDVLRGVRDRGRPGSPDLAYSEWCAERRSCASDTCGHMLGTPGCALDDVDLWREANPVLARRDPSLLAIKRNRQAMAATPGEFMRECLGWWDDPVGTAGGGIDPGDWAACGDPLSRRAGAIALGIAQSADRSTVSIAVLGKREDGAYHGELIEHRRATTTWVAPRVRDLIDKHHPVAVMVDPMSAAAGLIHDLEDAGVQVDVVKVGDLAAGCGRVFDLVKATAQPEAESASQVQGLRLFHRGDQHDLNAAVSSAITKGLPRGGWLWRQGGEALIEPLWALTLALVGFEQNDIDYDISDSLG